MLKSATTTTRTTRTVGSASAFVPKRTTDLVRFRRSARSKKKTTTTKSVLKNSPPASEEEEGKKEKLSKANNRCSKDAFKLEPNEIALYDTTLRDGAQQVGMSLTLDDKLAVSKRLKEIGVRFIEGGYPGSNPKDAKYFEVEANNAEMSTQSSSGSNSTASTTTTIISDAASSIKGVNNTNTFISAFGMTRRKGVSVEQDAGLQAMLDCPAPIACIVAKAWDEQCEKVLEVTLEENLELIEESVAYLIKNGKDVIVDAEHFYDGYNANPEYALKCLKTAANAGAKAIALCDTNGGMMPWDIEAITRIVVESLGDTMIGVHMHNDGGLAVANSIAGVRAGATMVQGCFNGYGERTGNADLVVIAANLALKMGKKVVPDGELVKLTECARTIAKICRQDILARQPYVGPDAFAHKGGLHVAALKKMPMSYNHILPELVGNSARSVVSELSGRGNVLDAAYKTGREVSGDMAKKVLAQIKSLESKGFILEDAGASVDILFQRAAPDYEAPFNVVEFTVHSGSTSFGVVAKEEEDDDRSSNGISNGSSNSNSNSSSSRAPSEGYKEGSFSSNQAIVKVDTFLTKNMETRLSVAEGNGPVDALAKALRSALRDDFPQLDGISLSDYKVDLLSQGGTTAAVTRVTIDFVDSATDLRWRTVGAHSSIIEASFRALVDGLEYGIERCADGCVVDFEANN
jgi:2-isopropylmalate synthase